MVSKFDLYTFISRYLLPICLILFKTRPMVREEGSFYKSNYFLNALLQCVNAIFAGWWAEERTDSAAPYTVKSFAITSAVVQLFLLLVASNKLLDYGRG